MTNLEKIEAVIRTLNNVRVPAALTESIAIPVYNATLALNEVFQSMQAEQKQPDDFEIKMEEEISKGSDK